MDRLFNRYFKIIANRSSGVYASKIRNRGFEKQICKKWKHILLGKQESS